ncbi:hypothetical protein L3556_13505 [Candidatus Synechococcus calcipolaris G9]|uniref:NYN domain-containing protein n=1 Tax=Candidatus Synechococcus calcipolaris G9 TaxID=1497997 RepID=A0ABT6F2A3_9SYNE|nr:hypothetical protein [Candidatus Synechococcus calcipolaris]MDG2991940.1 hypothetical protein [Candidatus Synechococcus calcipolaris G9]
MPIRIYCIDNDILKKLATFQLFEQTIKAFNINHQDIRILDTAKHKFRGEWEKFQKGRSRQPDVDRIIDYDQILALAERLSSIKDAPDPVLFSELAKTEGIDKGDAILTAYAIQTIENGADILLFTGDKRLVKALAQVNLPQVGLLRHRIWCLEQLVLKNIEIYGFEVVKDAIVSRRDCDKAIKAAFGSGTESERHNVKPVLIDYIERLRKEANNLLAPYV